MDEHRHKILETPVFFMTISQIKKQKPFHHSLTNIKAQQKKKKMKRDETKQEI
jgi:hypothetical protein